MCKNPTEYLQSEKQLFKEQLCKKKTKKASEIISQEFSV